MADLERIDLEVIMKTLIYPFVFSVAMLFVTPGFAAPNFVFAPPESRTDSNNVHTLSAIKTNYAYWHHHHHHWRHGYWHRWHRHHHHWW